MKANAIPGRNFLNHSGAMGNLHTTNRKSSIHKAKREKQPNILHQLLALFQLFNKIRFRSETKKLSSVVRRLNKWLTTGDTDISK